MANKKPVNVKVLVGISIGLSLIAVLAVFLLPKKITSDGRVVTTFKFGNGGTSNLPPTTETDVEPVTT